MFQVKVSPHSMTVHSVLVSRLGDIDLQRRLFPPSLVNVYDVVLEVQIQTSSKGTVGNIWSFLMTTSICMCMWSKKGSAAKNVPFTPRKPQTNLHIHTVYSWSLLLTSTIWTPSESNILYKLAWNFAVGISLKLRFLSITKTCLYNIDPHKPHFYIVKLGFTGYTLFFLFLLENIDCEYSLEPPHRDGSNEYPQSMFWAESFFIWKFSDFGGEIFYIFE